MRSEGIPAAAAEHKSRSHLTEHAKPSDHFPGFHRWGRQSWREPVSRPACLSIQSRPAGKPSRRHDWRPHVTGLMPDVVFAGGRNQEYAELCATEIAAG